MSVVIPNLRGAIAVPGWAKNELWRKARAVPSLDLRFADSKSLVDSRTGQNLVTFNRASSGMFAGSDGVVQTATTNLQRHSEDFTQGLTPSNATLTANQGTAPNGTLTADQFLETTVNGLHSQEIADHTFIAGAAYTFSCYAKSIGGRNFGPGFPTLFSSARFGFFDLSGNGSVVSANAGVTASIQAVGDGWYRCSITSTCVTGGGARVGVFIASGTSISYAGDITKGLLLWGAQLEQSATVGEYIPTTSTINSAPRFDHNPITGESLGLLVEEQRTNSIRNNTMVGAVVGTPGTLPTNWFAYASAGTGVSTSVIGTGTDKGVNYVDIRFNGTPSASAGWSIITEAAGIIPAATGQTWTYSAWVKLASGSTSNVGNPVFFFDETVGSTFVTGASISTSFLTSALNRYPVTYTLTGGATVNRVNAGLRFSVTSGQAIDFTLRIGLPQLELGAFATSVIPTTTAAATRSADVASITGTNFSGWYNASQFTLYTDIVRGYSGNFPGFSNFLSLNAEGGSSNIIAFYGIQNTTNLTNFPIVSGGSNQTDFVSRPSNFPSPNLIAQSLAVNSSVFTVNGVSTTEDTSVAMPVGVDRLTIGSDRSAASHWGGTIRRLTFWPTRLANETLQSITQ